MHGSRALSPFSANMHFSSALAVDGSTHHWRHRRAVQHGTHGHHLGRRRLRCGLVALGRRLVIAAGHDAPAPAAPAARLAAGLAAEHAGRGALLLPLGHALAHADHADELPLDDAADALNLVALVARAEEQRRRGALVTLVAVVVVVVVAVADPIGVFREESRDRVRVRVRRGRGGGGGDDGGKVGALVVHVARWCGGLVVGRGAAQAAASRILGVAVSLLLALAGGDALVFTAADDAAIRVANACAQTAEHFAVVVAPAPDATEAKVLVHWCSSY